MWAVRGFQSAVYYYVACTPCLICMSDRRRKKQNKIDRLERQAWERDIPNLYRHPSPAGRNPNWDEDRLMGPNHPTKNRKKKARNENEKQDFDEKTLADTADGTPDLGDSIGEGSTIAVSTMDGVRNALRQATLGRTYSGERWNRRRYEREDEELWEFDYKNPPPDAVHSSLMHSAMTGDFQTFPSPVKVDTNGTSTESFYKSMNPDLSELHPPVVFHPKHSKSGSRWMLQPPPSPAVMNGYQKAIRSPSDSGISKRQALEIGEIRLKRKISARVIQEHVLQGDPMDLPDLTFIPRTGSIDRSSLVSRGRARSSPKHDASDETTGTTVRHSPKPLSNEIKINSIEILDLPESAHLAYYKPTFQAPDFASTYGRLVPSPEPQFNHRARASTTPKSMQTDSQGIGPLRSADAELTTHKAGVQSGATSQTKGASTSRPHWAFPRVEAAQVDENALYTEDESAIADDEDNDGDAYDRYNETIGTPAGNFNLAHVHNTKPLETSPRDKFWGWGGRRQSVDF